MDNVIDLVLADGDESRIRRAIRARPSTLEDVARLAADPTKPVVARIAAVTATVDAVSVLDLPVPAVLADAVADDALVDEAIARGRANPFVAAVHQLKRHPGLEELRARATRRFIEARLRGINVAWLAIEIGDYETAVTLAIIDFEEHIAERMTKNPEDPIVSAWLSFVVKAPEPVGSQFLDSFGDRKDAILACLWPEDRAKLDRPKG